MNKKSFAKKILSFAVASVLVLSLLPYMGVKETPTETVLAWSSTPTPTPQTHVHDVTCYGPDVGTYG